MMDNAGFNGNQVAEHTCLAYSLSKNFLKDEMEDFDEYNVLRKFEFHEFLGRLSYLLYDEQRPLHKKIEDLLGILLGEYTS